MKRVNGFLFIVFVMLLLSGCSAKKIERVASSEHLGYTIESIKNDFSLDDFELAGESKTGNEIVFSNPQDEDLDQLSGRTQVIGDISYRFNKTAGAKNTYSLQLARPRDNSR